jgi:hypothetical protein
LSSFEYIQLLDAACTMSVADFTASGFSDRFYTLLPKLYAMVEARVTGRQSRPATRAPSPSTIDQPHIDQAAPANNPDLTPMRFDFGAAEGPGESAEFSIEGLWSSFFGSGVDWTGDVSFDAGTGPCS